MAVIAKGGETAAIPRRKTIAPAWKERWNAVFLSLATPGAGHLLARNPWGFAWFLATGLAIAATHKLAAPFGAEAVAVFLAYAACAALSARSALRLYLPECEQSRLGVVSEGVACKHAGRQVELTIRLETTALPATVWERIADLSRFLTLDPFHERVTLVEREPRLGATLVLEHFAFGRRFTRFGRLLAWRPGRGYTFSDLSAAGPRRGFPHAFLVDIEPTAAGASLRIRVRGRWTMRLIPTSLGMLWLTWVCREHARILRSTL